MNRIATQLLTNSRMQAVKTCPRLHQYEYELGIRPASQPDYFRIGTAGHYTRETASKSSPEKALELLAEHYDSIRPVGMSDEAAYRWDIERQTVLCLMAAYFWRWAEMDKGITVLAPEWEFEIPLTNPETGRPTPNFRLAGKLDGIIRLADGRQAIYELKIVSADLEVGSDFWRRLRIDSQTSTYYMAAEVKGHHPETILYDAIRKPTIQATRVPLCDKLGVEIVLDTQGERVKKKANNEWRRTGDANKGYVLQTRPMTPEEWGKKLTKDIGDRPDYYFARREVPRLDSDIEEHRFELWQMQGLIRECQRHNRWPRNTRACIGFGRCRYFDLCTDGFDVEAFQDDPGVLPDGYVRVENVHPELVGRSQ